MLVGAIVEQSRSRLVTRRHEPILAEGGRLIPAEQVPEPVYGA
jgi:hypothetical protein